MKMLRRVAVLLVPTALIAGFAVVPSATAASSNTNLAGVGSPAALSSPTCDRTTGRIKFPSYFAPPCVKPWKASDNNGGATSQGVTNDAIKVVVYLPTDDVQRSQIAAGSTTSGRNQGTGKGDLTENAVHDEAAIFEQVFQLWGRKVVYDYAYAPGTDEAAQRAGAIDVIGRKPFAVVDIIGGTVFDAAVASAKILVVGGSGTIDAAAAQAPYRWSFAYDGNANMSNLAEFMAKSLVGHPAQYAGDPALKTQQRKFGVIYVAGTSGYDIAVFDKALQRWHGGKVALEIPFTLPVDTSQVGATAQQQAPTLIGKLKDAGVNNVVVLGPASVIGPITKAASTQNYFPEWTATGFGSSDHDALVRSYDQQEWAHAFGLVNLPLWVENAPDFTTAPFQWYWGKTKGVLAATVYGALGILYAGLHMAGPTLTPATFRSGMFALPAQGGAASGSVSTLQRAFGRSAGLPYDEYLGTGTDYTFAWWNPDVSGKAQVVPVEGKGVYFYLDGGKRYSAGQWPKGEQKFFDTTTSSNQLASLPAKDQAPTYPCTGCPSQSG